MAFREARTTANLRLRDAPGLTAAIRRVMPVGERVRVFEGYAEGEWRIVQTGAGLGWASGAYLRLEGESAPGPAPAPLASKRIGLHVAGGHPPPGLVDMARRLAAAGKPLSTVVVVNHASLADDIKRASPQTFVVYRRVFGSDDATPDKEGWPTGEAWFSRLWGEQSKAQLADAHQFVNEWFVYPHRTVAEMGRFGKFYQELMDACTRRGVRCTIADVAPGNIEAQHLPALGPMFAQAERQGHVLNYHMYGSQHQASMLHEAGSYAMRWAAWVKPYPRLKVLGGEAGHFNGPRFRGEADTLRMMGELEGLLKPFGDQVIGAAWWTLAGNPGGWDADDFAPALGAVEAWLLHG